MTPPVLVAPLFAAAAGHWSGSILDWLLRSSWQAGVLVVLVLLAQWALGRRLSPRWRYSLWVVVLLRLVVPVWPASPVSIFNVSRMLMAGSPEASLDCDIRPAIQPPIIARTDVGDETGRASLPASRAFPSNRGSAGASPSRSALSPITTGFVLQAIWLLGLAAMLARIILASASLRRILRRLWPVTDAGLLELLDTCAREMKLAAPIRLLAGGDVRMPALCGIWRPVLLMPNELLRQLSPRELRLIFLHELAHVRRRDVAVNWLASLLLAIHWFNPLLWLAAMRVRADRELACDELVLRVARGQERQAYGQTILKLLAALSQRAALPGMVGILEGKHQMQRRITMIAHFRENSGRWSIVALVVAGLIGIVALTDAAGESRPRAAAAPSTQPARADFDHSTAAPAGVRLNVNTGGVVQLGGMVPMSGFGGVAPGAMPGMDGMPMMGGMGMAPPPLPLDPETEKANATTAALLRKPIPKTGFENVPLKDVLLFLRDVTGANFFTDWRQLEASGIAPDAQVSLQLKDVAAGEVLRLALRSADPNLGYSIEGGVVVIHAGQVPQSLLQPPPPAQAATVIKAYDVSDLLDSRGLTPAGGQTESAEQRAAAKWAEDLQKNLDEMQAKRAALQGKYGADHPELANVLRQTELLTQALARARMAAAKPSGPAPMDEKRQEQKMTQLIALIEATVRSTSAPFVVKGFNSKLIVTASEDDQQAVEKLLAMLREQPASSGAGTDKASPRR